MLDYAVRFVSEKEWAVPGQAHLFIRTAEGDLLLFFKECAVTPAVLEAAWADYREIEDQRAANSASIRVAVLAGINAP